MYGNTKACRAADASALSYSTRLNQRARIESYRVELVPFFREEVRTAVHNRSCNEADKHEQCEEQRNAAAAQLLLLLLLLLLARLGRLGNAGRSRSRCGGRRCLGQHRLMCWQGWRGILRLKGSGDHCCRGPLRADRIGQQNGDRGVGQTAVLVQLKLGPALPMQTPGRSTVFGRSARGPAYRARQSSARNSQAWTVRQRAPGWLQFARQRVDRRGRASRGLNVVEVEVEFAGFWRERIRRCLRVHRRAQTPDSHPLYRFVNGGT
jgi:hypothetical protein